MVKAEAWAGFSSTPNSRKVVASSSRPLFASEVLTLSKPGREARAKKLELSSVFPPSNGCANAFRGSHGKWQRPSLPIRQLFLNKKKKLSFETIRGPQTGMLPRLNLPGAQGAFKDSMIHFCNSHYLSQFAAFFIDGRTKRSVAKSCFFNLDDRITSRFHHQKNDFCPSNPSVQKCW